MGRFTLRSEGITIVTGKVLKYKPYTKGAIGAVSAANAEKSKLINNMSNMSVSQKPTEELVYNMETGEMSKAKPKLEEINEDEENN